MRRIYKLTDEQVKRIVSLLSSTDMMLSEIAERMSVCRSCIEQVNRKFQVRIYNGKRKSWSLKRMKLKIEISEGGPFKMWKEFAVDSLAECPVVGDTLCTETNSNLTVRVRFIDYAKNGQPEVIVRAR